MNKVKLEVECEGEKYVLFCEGSEGDAVKKGSKIVIGTKEGEIISSELIVSEIKVGE